MPTRESFRRYLEGLLLPQERNKTLTALANTEPVVGAQQPPAQSLQWFLSESTWDPEVVTQRRVEVLCADPLMAPTARGVLVIDEHGDRKWGTKAAHVGRQYLANLGKTDNGVVSVTSLWADEGVYFPLHVEPYTPVHRFARGKADPHFRTKRQIAAELVGRALATGIPCRAVVADSFYGEDESLRQELRTRGLGYVLACSPAMAEIVRLYGLRMWMEQSYKPTKYALGWHEYQVRSDRAIRRHWALVCCAFAFCWYNQSRQRPAGVPAPAPVQSAPTPPASVPPPAAPTRGRGGGKIGSRAALTRPLLCWPVALRAVRAWLEPWIMLWRYWRGWASAPPPAPLCALLDQLWHGHGIYLYVRPYL